MPFATDDLFPHSQTDSNSYLMNYKLGLSFTSLVLVIVGSIAPNLTLVRPSSAENKSVWRSFSPPGAGFSILMPGKVIERVDTEAALCLGTGKMTKKTTYAYHSEGMEQDGTIYAVFYSDYAKECEIVSAEGDLKIGLKLLSMAKSGVVKRKQMLRLNGHIGVEVRLGDGKSVALWTRAFVVPRSDKQSRVYEIMIFSAKADSLPKTLDGFMKSFKFTTP